MPLSHVIGKVLVEDDELRERAREGSVRAQAFRATLDAMPEGGGQADAGAAFTFSNGNVLADEVTPVQPVGIGKPATIIVSYLYTGRLGKADMLLTSAVRDPFVTFNQAPRAINLMPKRVPRRSRITGPAATENGTPLVYYVPALTAQSLTLTLDLSFDDFPDELVDQIGGAITGAAGIPIFGPYNGILLAVGQAIKLVSRLANALVDSRPDFSVTERLDFQIPGSPVPTAGFKVLHQNSLDVSALEFDLEKGLLHRDTRQPYDGDEPYIVFLLDGSKNDSFKAFTPTVASAAMLSRFLSQKEGTEMAIQTLTDSFKLFNDLRFRQEADRLQKQIDALPDTSEERKLLVERRDALLANILEDLLKPQ